MSAMRFFGVVIFALLLASCTKQGYSNPLCGFVQIINWMTFGAAEGFEEEVCGPEPTETAAANAPSPSPKPSSSPTQTAAATPASPSGDPNSTAQPPPGNTPPPDTSSSTPATPTTTAAANPCTTTCPAGSFCEVQTAQSGLGPPPEEEAPKAMAGLGPPPQEQAAAPTAGLGPPPQEQPATPTAGLGPPPNSSATPPPAGPSSPGTTVMPTPSVVPVPVNPPPQPPTARYNPGNVCNPVPPAPPKPGNVCNPTPPAASKPGNICNPSTPSKAGNAGQQTAAAPPQNPLSPPTGRMNSGECHTINGQTTCTDASGNSCTTTGGFCDPTVPQATPPKPNQGPLQLKPPTQMASAGNPCNQTNQKASVPACSSKPPYLPWGGHGSATITVSGNKPCGIGWHDTGATILDSMSVASPPTHGSLRPQDQHLIIFTPATGYKGQDSFTLSMQEHNGGRSATLSVKVSVTIQ